MKIGAQLYTVHDYTKNLTDFAETLKKVADIGYRYVQVSGTCEYTAEWLKEQLDKNGLVCTLTHTPYQKLVENTEEQMKKHRIFGCNNIGIGGMDGLWDKSKTLDECYDKFKTEIPPVLEKLKSNGFYFMYHNHDLEFAKLENDNEILLRRMAKDFPPEVLGFTLDVHWCQRGGIDPSELISELHGRVPCVHFKDYLIRRTAEDIHTPRFAAVGEGVLNFDKIIAACESSGTEYIFVEQDDCYGEDPFDCLKRSFENLKGMGL